MCISEKEDLRVRQSHYTEEMFWRSGLDHYFLRYTYAYKYYTGR